jgi:hypothetical protein
LARAGHARLRQNPRLSRAIGRGSAAPPTGPTSTPHPKRSMEPINWFLFAVFIAIVIWKLGKSFIQSRRSGQAGRQNGHR